MLIFAGLIGAYILGEGMEGVRIKDNLMLAFRSHKFQALLAGLLAIALKSLFPNFPLSEEQLVEIVGILAALILGAGVSGAIDNVSFKG